VRLALNPTVKNKSQKRGASFVREKRPSKHHHFTAFHHKLTTKTPRSTRTFSQNPQQKAHSTTQKKIRAANRNFSAG
jgi:hypothetical protein